MKKRRETVHTSHTSTSSISVNYTVLLMLQHCTQFNSSSPSLLLFLLSQRNIDSEDRIGKWIAYYSFLYIILSVLSFSCIAFYLFLYRFLSLNFHLSLSSSHSLSLSPSHSFSATFSLSYLLSNSLSNSLSTPYLFPSLSHSLSLILPLSPSLSPSLSPTLILSLPPSILPLPTQCGAQLKASWPWRWARCTPWSWRDRLRSNSRRGR